MLNLIKYDHCFLNECRWDVLDKIAAELASDDRSVEVSKALSEDDEPDAEWCLGGLNELVDTGRPLTVSSTLEHRHQAGDRRQPDVAADRRHQRRDGSKRRRDRRVEIGASPTYWTSVKHEAEDEPASHVTRAWHPQIKLYFMTCFILWSLTTVSAVF